MNDQDIKYTADERIKKMRCRNCKAEIEKGRKFCPKCGIRIRSVGRRLTLAVLILLIVIACAGTAGWKFGMLPVKNSDWVMNEGGFSVLMNSFTERKIVDQDSALAAIGDVADLLGIKNVNTEFANCKEDTVSGNTYYRFYQEYDGIPVYGRSMIVSADESGNSLMLSGNYTDVRNVKCKPKIDEAAALQYVQQYYGKEITIVKEGLVIYSFDDKEPELAWEIGVYCDGIQEACFVSAQNGEILGNKMLTYFAATEDVSRDISVYDAQNSTLNVQYMIVDSNGKIYEVGDNKELFDEHGNRVLRSNDNAFDITIYDEDYNIIGEHGKWAVKMTTKNMFTQLKPADTSTKKAVDVLEKVTTAYNFFETILERHSFDGRYGATAVVINDFLNYERLDDFYLTGDTENAYSFGYKDVPITVLTFGTDNSLGINMVAHEYTHSVERSISAMMYEGESGAIMEAYSDIFGEIIEDWSNGGGFDGSCDWIFDKNSRNIRSPLDSALPEYYKGKYWANTEEKDNDFGGVHTNNTVISHAAYLMYNGISGNNTYLQSLTTENLAHLFYETLYTLPSDCTFRQFRTLVQNMAEIMFKQGRLTYNQTRCISNAFFQVGIEPAVTPVSKDKLNIDIYSLNGQQYDDYTLYVCYGNGAMKMYSSEEIMKNGLSFPEVGTYELRIEDNANQENCSSIYVNAVNNGGVSRLPIYTQCGLTKTDIEIDDFQVNIKEGLYFCPKSENILFAELENSEISFTAWWGDYGVMGEATVALAGSDAVFTFGDDPEHLISGTIHFDDLKAIVTIENSLTPDISDKYWEYIWLRDSLWELSKEQLKNIAWELGIPEEFEVEYKQDDAYYWEAGGRYSTYVQILRGGATVATATVDSFSGELLKDIWKYSPAEETVIGYTENQYPLQTGVLGD